MLILILKIMEMKKCKISLSNGNNLIGSDQILLQPKEKKYSQSFLLEEKC